MTENITRVVITKPVGQGRFTLYFISSSGNKTVDDWRDAGTNANCLTWYNDLGEGLFTVPDDGSAMVELNYYKNSTVKASALLYTWSAPE